MNFSRRGFTLIEVTVALLIASMTVLVAHGVYSAAGDASARLERDRHALDRRMNTRRWLQQGLLSLEVGTGPGTEFAGHPDRLRFAARLPGVEGWSELRQIELRVEHGGLVAALDGESPFVLDQPVDGLELDYLLVPGEQTRWVREWVSPSSAPLAVRLRLRYPGSSPTASARQDTLLLLIKERG